MKDVFPLPEIPGYVDIKEAARILGVAESSVYRYVQSERLPAYQAGRNIMIELESLKQFKPGVTGRPRKKNSLWHISPDTSPLLVMYIRVNVYSEKAEALQYALSKIRQEERHLFPGTAVRYISIDDTSPISVTIQLVWRDSDKPDEVALDQEVAALKSDLADILDWNTAQYTNGKVLIHT